MRKKECRLLPTLEEAVSELETAGTMNPGPWTAHSRNAGLAARAIARRCGLDGDKAEVLGCLHDIGRRVGVVSISRHVLEGYRYCMRRGWDEAARIALTHSYPIGAAELDAPQSDEEREIAALLQDVEWDDYDRLICLCDSLALSNGFCLMEKRWVDVCLRYGLLPHTLERWNALLGMAHDFEARMGCCLYDVLPGVKETTFQPLARWTPPAVNKT
ncbi:MAG: HD domain-containing protein [Eubacteriales bacterium]|nr:HD domain-containing protein [Eubacteriales bacterium]